MTFWAFLLGFLLGGFVAYAFTRSWHHKFLADGFSYLANVARMRDIEPDDVSRAFGRKSGEIRHG